jgi:hypothetical protein
VRLSVAAAIVQVALCGFYGGCSSPHHTLAVVPTLPRCVAVDAVNSLRITALGDFAPAAPLTASASALANASLDLPRATRVVAIDGFGPMGLGGFGRTAPLSLDDVAGGKLGIAFGPPDGLCATATPAVARSGHRATRLSSGAVLVTGGWDGDGPATNLEIYLPNGDASDGTAHFRLVNATLDRRVALAHAVAPLGDGGALLSGGVSAGTDGQPDGIASQGATRHDANGERVGEPHLLPDPRAGHSATTLPDGRVLLAGGCAQFSDGACTAGAAQATTLLYDPASDAFNVGPPLGHARWGHTALLRGDGSVLLVGGAGEGGALPAELVDPDESRSFDAGIVSGAAALLPTGAALVTGGIGAPDTTAALWLSADEAPLPLPALGDPRQQPTVTTLEDGAALVAGGGAGPLYVYDGRGDLQPLAATFDARGHTATLLADGTVLLVGGADAAGVPAARALVYFRSQLSPYANLPPLTLDTAADPLLPRRPDRAAATAGQLVVAAADAARADGAPAEWSLLAGEEVADFTLTLNAGRRAAAGAALLLGFVSEAAYAFVVVEPGRPVALWTVTAPRAGQTVVAPLAGCSGQTLDDGELPDGMTTPLTLAWRSGRLTLTSARTLLSCRPGAAIARGRVGLGALHGSAVFAAPTLVR